MSCTYLSKLLLTTMIINELQTSTAITSKKLYPLNTNKLANIHPATQLNSQCSAITLLDRQSTETTACRLNLPLLSQKKIQAIIIRPTAKLSHPLNHPFTPPLAFTNALPSPSQRLSHHHPAPCLSSLPSAVLSPLLSLFLRFRSRWGQKPCMKNEITSIRWPWQCRINPHQLGSDSSP